MVSSVPLWRGYEPIAIFAGKNRKRKGQSRTADADDNQTETLFKDEGK
jgi:hypothetical protein